MDRRRLSAESSTRPQGRRANWYTPFDMPTMTIELSDEATERLRAEAAARGTTVETLVAERAQAAPAPPTVNGRDFEDETAEEAAARNDLIRRRLADGDSVSLEEARQSIAARHGWARPK